MTITVNGYTYRTTAVRLGGRFLAPREVTLPPDLEATMDDAARTTYDALSFTHRKEWVRWVEHARKPETRATRVARTVASLREGKRTR